LTSFIVGVNFKGLFDSHLHGDIALLPG